MQPDRFVERSLAELALRESGKIPENSVSMPELQLGLTIRRQKEGSSRNIVTTPGLKRMSTLQPQIDLCIKEESPLRRLPRIGGHLQPESKNQSARPQIMFKDSAPFGDSIQEFPALELESSSDHNPVPRV